MNKYILLNKALKERKIESNLKKFFQFMENLYGDEFSSLILSTTISPKESLEMFTSSFPNITDTDIILALIKASILSRDVEEKYNRYVRHMVSNGRFEDLMNVIYNNRTLRKQLTMNYIRDCYGTNQQIYSKKEDNDNTLGDMLSIIYFQESIKSKKNEKKEKVRLKCTQCQGLNKKERV